jgi:hypothetical protein
MKTLLLSVLGVIVASCAVTQLGAERQDGRRSDGPRGDQVCVYRDVNYQGAEQCYLAGADSDTLGAGSKSISSIRVYGHATVTVFENTSFRGQSAQFTSDVPDLGRRMMAGNKSWSDRIESIRVTGSRQPANTSDRRSASDFRHDREQQPRDGICVYDRPSYQGRSECWNRGRNISDVAKQTTWGRQISSIRLFGPSIVTVYQDTGFGGKSLTIDRDTPDLAAIPARVPYANGRGRGTSGGSERGFENWDHQISSLQIHAR